MSKSKPNFGLHRRHIALLLFLGVCSWLYVISWIEFRQEFLQIEIETSILQYIKQDSKRILPALQTTNQTHVSVTLATHLLSNKSPNSNVVFSPLSIHIFLGLIAAGSEGQTLDQLLSFLKINTIEELNALSSQLVSTIMIDASKSGGPCLASVNGVWVDQTVHLKDSFKQVVDTVYNANAKQVDFQSKADEIAKEANLWAKKQTNGLIKDILPPDAVNNDTRLIFGNAVYFKGVWVEKFDRSWTRKHDFHLLDGRKVQVPFMSTYTKRLMRQYDGFKVSGLPYVHGEDKRRFTMYFYLPDKNDGLPSLIQKINSESGFLESHIPREKVDVTKFLIPKFKISFGFEVSDSLKELGVVLPFRDGGLTEMVEPPDPNLYVSSIHQKSFVEINEEGAEAGTTTFAIMTASVSMIYDFVADHPFLFVIREDTTGGVLLMGQVVDPSVA